MKLFYGAVIEIPKEFLPKEELEAIDGLEVYEHKNFDIIGISIEIENDYICLSTYNFKEQEDLYRNKILDAIQLLLSSLSKKAQNGEEIPDLPEEINFDWFVIK